jgi:hypothetical protein
MSGCRALCPVLFCVNVVRQRACAVLPLRSPLLASRLAKKWYMVQAKQGTERDCQKKGGEVENGRPLSHTMSSAFFLALLAGQQHAAPHAQARRKQLSAAPDFR